MLPPCAKPHLILLQHQLQKCPDNVYFRHALPGHIIHAQESC
jgi:hypothetical protein